MSTFPSCVTKQFLFHASILLFSVVLVTPGGAWELLLAPCSLLVVLRDSARSAQAQPFKITLAPQTYILERFLALSLTAFQIRLFFVLGVVLFALQDVQSIPDLCLRENNVNPQVITTTTKCFQTLLNIPWGKILLDDESLLQGCEKAQRVGTHTEFPELRDPQSIASSNPRAPCQREASQQLRI